MTPAEMRAKRDSLFEEVFQKRCEDGVPYTAAAKEMQRDDWNEAFDAAHALMSEELERTRDCAEKLAEAATRLLARRIDHNGGIGAYEGGPAFVVEPMREELAHFEKLREGK